MILGQMDSFLFQLTGLTAEGRRSLQTRMPGLSDILRRPILLRRDAPEQTFRLVKSGPLRRLLRANLRPLASKYYQQANATARHNMH
jgi:hypothetical protein